MRIWTERSFEAMQQRIWPVGIAIELYLALQVLFVFRFCSRDEFNKAVTPRDHCCVSQPCKVCIVRSIKFGISNHKSN